VAVRGFLPAGGAGNPGSGERWQIKEAPLFCLLPLCFTAIACIVLFFFADELYAFLRPIGGGG
jgi:multicomponent Na+:H+ antiporter subunit D